MKKIFMADDPFQLKVGKEKYYSFADLVSRFEPEDYAVIDKETGEEVNIYKVLWELYRDVLLKYEELHDKHLTREKIREYYDWAKNLTDDELDTKLDQLEEYFEEHGRYPDD